ncbi:hypothetical protein ACFQNF_18205 [Iodobacter arcticus]|uniref:Uncharacterized protein n=1 Tax=Iodobacter arcticus TaxID=590593 RepID=A0ABW2R1I2_9NEIS
MKIAVLNRHAGVAERAIRSLAFHLFLFYGDLLNEKTIFSPSKKSNLRQERPINLWRGLSRLLGGEVVWAERHVRHNDSQGYRQQVKTKIE